MIDLKTIIPLLANAKIDFVIIGGVAATIHGSSYLTGDIDICYSRDRSNLERLVETLTPFHPRLRGVPPDLPFLWDLQTLLNGLNFTLRTDLGDVDLLGEVQGIGSFVDVKNDSITVSLFEASCYVISLDGLILAKRAAGREKDRLVLPELEAIREAIQGE